MGFDGISVLEVFSLLYLGNNEIQAEQQLGEIIMEFDSGCKRLYYQDEVDMSKASIKLGDFIFVKDTGPICSFKELDMQFDLFCGAYKGSIKLAFEPFQNRVWFEERRITSVDGTGQISAVFGLLSNATIANLEIQLFNISAPANVYGIVAARNNKLDQPACTSVLFWKTPANKIQVGCDGVIPLSKSRVGVPLDSELYLDISLYIDGDHYTNTSTFDPQLVGRKSVEVVYPEKKTKISVKVIWDSKENSVFRTYNFVYRELDDDDESDSEEDTEEG